MPAHRGEVGLRRRLPRRVVRGGHVVEVGGDGGLRVDDQLLLVRQGDLHVRDEPVPLLVDLLRLGQEVPPLHEPGGGEDVRQHHLAPVALGLGLVLERLGEVLGVSPDLERPRAEVVDRLVEARLVHDLLPPVLLEGAAEVAQLLLERRHQVSEPPAVEVRKPLARRLQPLLGELGELDAQGLQRALRELPARGVLLLQALPAGGLLVLQPPLGEPPLLLRLRLRQAGPQVDPRQRERAAAQREKNQHDRLHGAPFRSVSAQRPGRRSRGASSSRGP